MTKSPNETIFEVKRLSVAVPDIRGFQRTFEAAVPDQPLDQVTAMVRRQAPWSDVVKLLESRAPYGFLVYARHHPPLITQAAGGSTDCVTYLIGDHVTAEKMFRHDRRAMLYAPLRAVIWGDSAGGAWFTVDQPSTQFGSHGIPEVAKMGVLLDRKLAILLAVLDLEIPEALLQS